MTDEVKAPIPGSAEYDQAMAAKLDESAAKALSDATGKPLEETPAEPEKKDSLKVEEKPAEEAPAEKKEGEEEKTPEETAKEALEEKGLDFDSLSNEFAEKGELTPESYEKLEKAGIPKAMVDAYIAGQEALAAQRNYRGYEVAGGQDQFGQMQEWAKTNLTKPEIELFNKSVAGSEEEMLQAIRGLRSRFESEYGRQPNLLGGRANSGTQAGYASRAEMTADMRDPRYAKDSAFRAKVEAKVAATTAF